MSVERIYIGGLEPPRLKGSEILSRLKSLSDVEIQSVIADEDKTFVHLTAVSKGDASALQIISKAYHNVKWKGCRIMVASAKPHFLERLAEEIRQRQEGKEKAAVLATDPQQKPESKHIQDPNIPRRLRIRRRFGDEAFHVDTKPVVAEDWSNFSRAIHKVRKRREKHFNKTDEEASASHSTSFMNRAVHLRFSDQHKKTTATVGKTDDSAQADLLTEASGGGDDNVVSSSSSEDEGSVSSKEDADNNLEKVNDPEKGKKSDYGWSDDSASEDEDDGGEDKIHESKEDGQMAPSTEPTANKKEPIAQGYEWSSDESSSDDELDRTVSKRPFKPHAATDEFAAGMDDFNDDYNANEPDWAQETEDSQVDRAESSDLVTDVSGNLNVLSSIFPGMSNAQPVAQLETATGVASESGKEKEREPSRSGWGAGGLMLRFDPNAKSAQQFLVDETGKVEDEAENDEDKDSRVEEEAKDDEVMASGSDGDSDEDSERSVKDVEAETKPEIEREEEEGSDGESKSEALKEEPAEEEVNRVYEQEKLEGVFRNAREAWHGVGGSAAETPVDAPATSGSSMPSTGVSFSFGFDLGKPEEKKEPKTAVGSVAGFSFSFSLGEDQTEQQEIQTPAGIEQKNSVEEVDTKNEMISAPDEATPEVRRRKGSALPGDVLESYQCTFFSLNDGNIIMEDVDGYRRDEGVKEQWNHERQTLTLDWKRKRKFAQSRMEKKWKFR
jgi:hypothetical protein